MWICRRHSGVVVQLRYCWRSANLSDSIELSIGSAQEANQQSCLSRIERVPGNSVGSTSHCCGDPGPPSRREAISNWSLVIDPWISSPKCEVAQLRMKADCPACQMLYASHSLYVTTPGGDMVPTQRAALSNARAVSGLLTVTMFFSMIGPPPSETCHSRALQVTASDDAPSHTKPQKSFWPLARSPA